MTNFGILYKKKLPKLKGSIIQFADPLVTQVKEPPSNNYPAAVKHGEKSWKHYPKEGIVHKYTHLIQSIEKAPCRMSLLRPATQGPQPLVSILSKKQKTTDGKKKTVTWKDVVETKSNVSTQEKTFY